jgi:hypothetical protein
VLRVHLQHTTLWCEYGFPLPALTLPAWHISLPQALAEALTTSKAMVGRRLLKCSDLSTRICIGFGCATIGFEGGCNEIVNAFKVTWDAAKTAAVDVADAAKEAAVDAANAAKEAAVNAANAAKEAAVNAANAAKAVAIAAKEEAEKALDAVTGWFEELGEDIQCARPPPTQGARRGSMASRANGLPRALWYPCTACAM